MLLLLVLLVQTSTLFTTGLGSLTVLIAYPVAGPVKSGDNITLNCSVLTGAPADSISWYNDKKIEMKLTNYSVAWDSLLLTSVTLDDSVRYRCQAKKGSESDYDDYTLEVYAKPEIQLPAVWIVKTSSSPGVDCKATGFPKPQLTWEFNGAVLKSGTKFNSIYFGSDKCTQESCVSTLQLFHVNKELHYGNYTCKATNEMGTSRRTTQLLVNTEPTVIAGGVQIIRESGNVTLTCEGRQLLKEDTSVELSWEFRGKKIPKDNDRCKQRTTRVPGQAVAMELMLMNASTNDTGRYTCSVQNSVKRSSGQVSLTVVSKDVKPKASIIGPAQRTVKLGSNIAVQCEISYPAYLSTVHMFWSNSTAEYRVTNKSVDGFAGSKASILSLHIMNIRRQDLGSYICGVNTSIGSSETQVILRVTARRLRRAPQDSSNNSLVAVAIIITAGVVSGLCGAFLVRHLRFKKKSRPYGSMNNQVFKYDVFITFSGKDFGWVKTKMLPLLEKHGVEYCIHNRDFELGKAILDNMADSVYMSKKVLAVMSKNYMESKYCRGELEMALYRSTEMGDSSVIVIRIDSIEKDKLPKALRNRTFLDYYDETERKTWTERIIKHLTKKQF